MKTIFQNWHTNDVLEVLKRQWRTVGSSFESNTKTSKIFLNFCGKKNATLHRQSISDNRVQGLQTATLPSICSERSKNGSHIMVCFTEILSTFQKIFTFCCFRIRKNFFYLQMGTKTILYQKLIHH